MAEIEINPQFEKVLEFINQTNQPVFLTGKAGTGKTTLLKYIRQNTFKQMAVCAPTGVAAINAGGSTIHSFFQFPFSPFLPLLKDNGQIDTSRSGGLPTLKYNAQRLSIFRNLELLVIDEISMVRADLLDQIDLTLRQARRKWNQPFGGVQILLIGDMYQLPPVVQQEEWALLSKVYHSPFFFESLAIRDHPPVYIELEKIYRQSEDTFISLLNKVRNNEMDRQTLELLNSHYKPNLSDKDFRDNITLTTHNRKADEINSRNLASLPGRSVKFSARVEGQFSDRNYPADESLVLKVGARVMFLKNNAEKNYYNGKIGIVTSLDADKIKVKCDEDRHEIEVGREVWTNVAYKLDKNTKHIDEEVLGTFNQYPLRHAWAITIHKSQGLTFDKLIIDAAEAFSAGQVYVALSRCRSLAGLTLSSRINVQSLLNDQNILSFASRRQNEEQLDSIFSNAQKSYFNSVLSSLFDFSELLELRKELAGALQLHGKKLGSGAQDWPAGFYQNLEHLHEVGLRFRYQMGSIISQSNDPEKDPLLRERLQKAAGYFGPLIVKNTDNIRECPLRTDSKEAATELNAIFKAMFEDLFAKEKLIGFCGSGFNFSGFVREKLRLVYPDMNMSVYASSKNTKVSADVLYPELFRKLMEVRDRICNEDQKPIYMVAGTKTLTELCNFLPQTEEQLLMISGFGPAKVDAFGEQFLTVIRHYADTHDLETNMPLKKEKKKTKEKKEPKTKTEKEPSSREKTFSLFKEGLNVYEIATVRSMAESTIEAHLLPFIASGEINISRLMTPEKKYLIERTLNDLNNTSGLGAIKAALPPDVTYSEIRFVLALRRGTEEPADEA